MNKVILMGRITHDPELRRTPSDVASLRFNIAVNRNYKNDKGEYDTDFISCQAWRTTAEFIAKHFVKGQLIALVGEIRTGSYTDKNHPDVTHYTTDINVDNVYFTGDKRGTEQGAGAPAPTYAAAGYQQPPQQPQQQPNNVGGYGYPQTGPQQAAQQPRTTATANYYPQYQNAPQQPQQRANDPFSDLSGFADVLGSTPPPF